MRRLSEPSDIMTRPDDAAPMRLAIVVKGYPRLSETFIAQEILALEQRGFAIDIWSLRRPTDKFEHPMHKRIHAPRLYLPEYLYQAPWRVIRGVISALQQPGLVKMLRAFIADFKRDRTANRLRRLGQAVVFAREIDPQIRHVYVHYLHTPASVARYAALLTGRSWSFSAHAKDIWTTPDWEISEKIGDADWGVTCTAQGHERLSALAPNQDLARVDIARADQARAEQVSLVYHGLDLTRFPEPPTSRPARDGSDPANPVRLISVGRAVAKKGYDDLLQALAALPSDLSWRFAHVGGGELLASLKAQAMQLGLGDRVIFLGAKAQPEIIELMREADIFVLPAKAAATGDRDGLPNVLMEAASQQMAILASDFAGIPEFIRHEKEGVLVPPGDFASIANGLNLMAREPERRTGLGRAALIRLKQHFGMNAGIDTIATKLRTSMGIERTAPRDMAGK
jgi:glycosyltransferase involved in cell wall biosynthesis